MSSKLAILALLCACTSLVAAAPKSRFVKDIDTDAVEKVGMPNPVFAVHGLSIADPNHCCEGKRARGDVEGSATCIAPC